MVLNPVIITDQLNRRRKIQFLNKTHVGGCLRLPDSHRLQNQVFASLDAKLCESTMQMALHTAFS